MILIFITFKTFYHKTIRPFHYRGIYTPIEAKNGILNNTWGINYGNL